MSTDPSPEPGTVAAHTCVTCSDTAVPGIVHTLLGDDLALVDTGSGCERVSVALVTAKVGDMVLVHAGEAIAVPANSVSCGDKAAPATDIQSLYPFLYRDGTNLTAVLDAAVLDAAVLDEVCKSTVEKAKEITHLRRLVLQRDGQRLLDCARAMARRFAAGGRLLAFGNGGSSTDSQDLASLFLSPAGAARALPAIGLTNDIAVITALTNDIGFDIVFSRQIAAIGQGNDIAIGLSTSGNSENLLRGFDEANRCGLLTIGIAGYNGGKMAERSSIDYLFVVPSSSVHRTQEAQTTIYHVLWELTTMAMRDQSADDANGKGT